MIVGRRRQVRFGRLAGLLATTAVTAALPQPQAATAATEPDYEPTFESLSRHQVPDWFTDAKLGIFTHWGPYSVPAYAPTDGSGRRLAEWYWLEQSYAGDTPTRRHHLETWGPDVQYDDFIEMWQPNKYNPHEWLDLFQRAGAKYYVQVSKHHDGVALWDTAISGRNTVDLGPGRDLIAEMFDAANESDYGLKMGLYYSLPEWFHPDYTGPDDGVMRLFPGGPPHDPYTGAEVPYTGWGPVDDYIQDHQVPQIRELIDKFDPDILWCDIRDSPNDSNQWQAYYFNKAKNRPNPKQVAVNDRCNNGIQDFVTREYTVEEGILTQKWEATRGIGRSFGYNAQEDVGDYLTDDELIDSFADIVSKNGNLLLNVGPKADGSIPDIQRSRLLALGDWLRINGEAIYGSTYWWHAEDGNSNVPVRYTVQDDAIYVTALDWPGQHLTLSADLPLADDTAITLLGSDGTRLPWQRNGDVVTVTMPPSGAAATASKHAFTFKIATGNLAVGKQATQQSDYQADAGQAGLAVDGNTDGTWSAGSVTHTAPGAEPWWQVDLGQRGPINEVAVWNRTDACCRNRLDDYYVFVSNEPFTGDSVAETLAQPGVRAYRQQQVAGRPTPVPIHTTGRYVRVQLDADRALSLAEVQVWANTTSNTAN